MKSAIEKIDLDKKEESSINLDFFSEGSDITLPSGVQEEPKKTRGRKKKALPGPDGMNRSVDGEVSQRELTFMESNKPYKESYCEGENLLRGSIMQIDKLQGDISEQLDMIKSSKTLKRKYDYIANLTGSASSLISTRIGAIKEMNKIVSDSHNFDLKRQKDMAMSAAKEDQDDNKKIMDLYNAFISTPMNAQVGNMPSIVDLTFAANTNNMGMAAVGNAPMGPSGINSVNNMMRLEHDPNVETVVVYDAATGNRWFDVVNLQTGEAIPNVEKPDAMFLEDTKIDARNGIARNTNLDITYKLIVLNQNDLMEY